MNGSFMGILVVLDILLQGAILVDREDVAVACIVVEWVRVDIVGRFLSSKEQDGSGFGVCLGSLCWNILSLSFRGIRLQNTHDDLQLGGIRDVQYHLDCLLCSLNISSSMHRKWSSFYAMYRSVSH